MGPNKGVEGGVEKSMLHGNTNMENQRELGGNQANKVDLGGDLGESIRKAVVLDYIEGGDDNISSRTSGFKSKNSEFIDLPSPDSLYPGA